MNLFQFGDFTLASGQKNKFKIDCDALTKEDWASIASIAHKMVPPYAAVYGVPTGGIKFAQAMWPYATDCNSFLVVDDVWTTGQSMLNYTAKIFDHSRWHGLVLFARRPVKTDYVRSVFTTDLIFQDYTL